MDEVRRAANPLASGSSPSDGVEPSAVPSSIREAAADPGADELAATNARRRYQAEGMASLGPDPMIAGLLAPGEDLLAVRRCIGFERRPASRGRAVTGRADLYVTSERLVLLGERADEVGLDEIDEIILSGGRLLVALRCGAGLALEVERPRLLRVEIAAARAAAHAAAAERSQGHSAHAP